MKIGIIPGSETSRRALALLAISLLGGPLCRPLAAQAPPPATLSQGLDALQASHPRQALATFQQVLAANPANATANLLAATAAIELCQGNQAVQYAEKARQLDPQNWKIHTTLVAAYAEAGMTRQRDQERALLRHLHATGQPDARQATGFLLEIFPVPGASSPEAGPRVEAIEEFEPLGRFHTYYRFLVRQPDGRRLAEIDVQSNDFDQKSWAAAHPAQAAAGERQFQIVGHTAPSAPETDYRMFSGQPDYDTIRAMIVRILTDHPNSF